MLPIEKLPVDVKGLTPEMQSELENRISEFEADHEKDVANGGAGYVDKIRKRDFVIAGTINGLIVIYFIIAVLFM